ncbi:MAG: GAF domain-containing protein [Spirochaetes bacterium]|nr:GAF domain-containing protein [Spirochaetota bacterium]
MTLDEFNRHQPNIDTILTDPASEGTRLQNLCDYLKEYIDHYDWVGFYLSVPGERMLALGPFSGEPTEHIRIPYGRGICGQAADREETFVIQDVTTQDNYLACSLAVKSEIVVPVFHEGAVVGEIDIDSHGANPFTDADNTFLEELARRVAPEVAAILR